MVKNKQPQGSPAEGPDFLDAIEVPAKPAMPAGPAEGVSRMSKKYIVCKSTPYKDHVYAPGQIIEVPEDAELPANVMAMENSGVSTGPHYFALKECTRNGITFKVGELWNRPTCQEPAAAGLFAPLEQRSEFEFVEVDGVQRAELHRRKPFAPVGPGPNRPAA